MSIEGGKKIKAARKAQHLTQGQLAEKLNLATGTIQQYELGKRQPPTQTIEKIADILSVSPFDLVGDGDPVSIHWIDLDAENQGKDIIEHMTELIRNTAFSSKSSAHKMTDAELFRAGILQFHLEEDRIVHFYKQLTDEGKIAAGGCFFRHLDKDSIKEVADYVMSLSENQLYQRPTSPQSPPASAEGTDTTPPPDGSEGK